MTAGVGDSRRSAKPRPAGGPKLSDVQVALRDAIVANDPTAILPLLEGGRDPSHRLSIHQRHYEVSLVDLLRKRFPALEWIVGEAFLKAAAIDFARARPPTRPALGSYGERFPWFLAARPGAAKMPWLAHLGALEWHLAEIAAAIDAPAVTLGALAVHDATPLEDLFLRLQPGLAYAAYEWPVDTLVRLHLDGNAPDSLAFEAEQVFLELVGARGRFTIRRVDESTLLFRRALAAGASVAAAIAAVDGVAGFDPGMAMATLFGDGMVTDVRAGQRAK